jgi:RHS repeat-associated protein
MFSATAYAPFGEPYGSSGTPDPSFTGQNQDTVPGLYDFMFREYSPNQGRFVSTDPAGSAAVSLTNPQSFNRYAYVDNSPLNATDPLGLLRHLVCDAEGNCVISGGGDDAIFNGGGFGGAGGYYGGDTAHLFSPITAPNAQLAAWEQQAELDYQRQVDCGFYGGCPHGVTRAPDGPPGMIIKILGGSVSGIQQVDPDSSIVPGTVVPGSLFDESFGPEWISWDELVQRALQYPAARDDARMYTGYVKAHPGATRDDFDIYKLSLQVDWYVHHEITPCQLFLEVGIPVASAMLFPGSTAVLGETLGPAVDWAGYGLGVGGPVVGGMICE